MLNENLLNQARKFGRFEYRVVSFVNADIARIKITIFDTQGGIEGVSYTEWNEGELADRGFKV